MLARRSNPASSSCSRCDHGLAANFLRPPYGRATARWIARLAAHGNGCALVFARTDTRWWQESIFGRASALLFLRGRLRFRRPDGREEQAALRRAAKKLDGAFVELEKKS